MLKVVTSGTVAFGHFTPSGCHACHSIVPDGAPLLLVDDQEYLPTFCVACVSVAVLQLAQHGEPTTEPDKPSAP